jgi:molecular chaperone DnaK
MRSVRCRGSSSVIGIDLGTTKSVVAVVLDGEATIVPSAEGSRLSPSVVAVNPQTGERMVGQVASRQAVVNPENTIFSVKRLMGRKLHDAEVQTASRQVPYRITAAPNGDARVWMGGKVYSPPEVSAMILQKLRADAEAFLGRRITRAVVTVPAYFDDSQRQATKTAGRIAGLEVLRIINEPTAASLAYGLRERKDEAIAVYHLGGGTFDISILSIGDGVFQTLATAGDTFLGGDDWDWRVADWAAGRFRTQHHIDLRHGPQALKRLREACEQAKIELSTVTEAEIDLPFITADASGAKHLQMPLTRARLEQLTGDLVERTVGPCRQALADANRKPSEIDEVILVGGMTRMPVIQEKVAQLFGREPRKGVNPDEAVGLGAGIYGGVLDGLLPDVLLLDATPLTLGIETQGGVATTLIERNTTIPTLRSQVFSTTSDGQTRVDIHVVQGEHPMAVDNRSLAKVVLDGIPPAPKGVPQIEVTFQVDADSTLTVSAQDKATGGKQSLQVIPSIGLSGEEVERMVGEAEQYRAQDRRRREGSEVRDVAQRAVDSAERLLRERGDGMPSDLFSETEAGVAALTSALEGKDVDAIRRHTDELVGVLQQAGTALMRQEGGPTWDGGSACLGGKAKGNRHG